MADCELLVVPRRSLLSLLERRPEICLGLLIVLCERLRRTMGSARGSVRGAMALLASTEQDPRPALFAQEHGEVTVTDRTGLTCGFYWTEGIRGLGWAVDAVPTLKGGSIQAARCRSMGARRATSFAASRARTRVQEIPP